MKDIYIDPRSLELFDGVGNSLLRFAGRQYTAESPAHECQVLHKSGAHLVYWIWFQ